ncbi:MAG: hypothetical protein ACI36Y_03710 [Coriobacteriales bacterium]
MAAPREYSVTRTRATWKPLVQEEDPTVFRCTSCGNIHLGLAGPEHATYSGTGRTLVAELPCYNLAPAAPSCCGSPMERLEALSAQELQEQHGIEVDYAIVGGYNSNAVRFAWSAPSADLRPSWVLLKTYTGMQVKYLLPGKRSPLVFALADEDAYVYCDKPQCQECIFMCKRGFVFYACFPGIGLVELPLSRATAIGGKN